MQDMSEEAREDVAVAGLDELESLLKQIMEDGTQAQVTQVLAAVSLNLTWQIQVLNDKVDKLEAHTARLDNQTARLEGYE